jgi:hypothetical protein
VRGDLDAYGRVRLPQAVLLGGQHVHHLLAPLDQGCESLALCVGQRPWRGVNGGGEVRQHRGVHGVGLGQAAGGLGPRRAPDAD